MVFISCDSSQNGAGKDDKLLASVYGEHLYKSEVNTMMGSYGRDSTARVNSYIEAWVRDRILYDEAKKSGLGNKKINDLVEDYRKSLFIHRLEERYLDENLDTNITLAEIDSFYMRHDKDFILESPIYRVFLVKIPVSHDNDTLAQHWKTEDLPALRSFVLMNEGTGLLDIGQWYKKSDLRTYLPEKVYNRIYPDKPIEFSAEDGNFKYYVKVLEILKEGEQGPVNFYYNNIRDRILHQRSRVLLQKMKTDLYKSRIKNKNIKIYSKEES